MTTIQKALGTPVKIMVGGIEKLMSPLTFNDKTTFEQFSQDQIVARVSRGRELSLQEHVDVCLKCSFSFFDDECQKIMDTTLGRKLLLWLGIRHNDTISFGDFCEQIDKEEYISASKMFFELNYPKTDDEVKKN
jgi:hypothetical protein